MEQGQTYRLKDLEIKILMPPDKFGNAILEVSDPQKKTIEQIHYNEPGKILKGFHFNKYWTCAQ